MKNVTFIIGNGFDIKLGLNTRYSDFYKVYKNIPEENPIILHFKKNILNNKEQNWRDFEYGMGQCKKFNNPQDYILCYQDFASKLNDYLLEENERLNLEDISSENQQNFVDSLFNFHVFVQTIQSDKVKSFNMESGILQINLNVIQLNYTNVFDELYKNLIPRNYCEKGRNLHAHGRIGGHNHAMGVNDISQIADPMIKNDDLVRDTFVKTNFHTMLQNENVNKITDYTRSQEIIKSTNTFCIFGCSIGETDKFWWKQIGQRLSQNSNTHLIIFDICNINAADEGINQTTKALNNKKKEQRKIEIIQNFLRQSELGENWIEKNEDRIFVELNTDIFNINIPTIEKTTKSDIVEEVQSL